MSLISFATPFPIASTTDMLSILSKQRDGPVGPKPAHFRKYLIRWMPVNDPTNSSTWIGRILSSSIVNLRCHMTADVP